MTPVGEMSCSVKALPSHALPKKMAGMLLKRSKKMHFWNQRYTSLDLDLGGIAKNASLA